MDFSSIQIKSKKYPTSQKNYFSILIPTWNNLEFLKTCIRSIRQHSHFSHQIIVHVNEGSDGTLQWVQENQIDHTFSDKNVGVCYALNAAAKLADTDYIVFVNDDMYVLPNWDLSFYNEIAVLPTKLWFLSGTMIEPLNTSNPCVIFANYGTDLVSFKETELLKNFKNYEKLDWSGATWPPNIVHKELWEKVGGYSVEFSPGIGSDPDFSMKLWQHGVRYFKGLSECRVYHFQTKTTGRIQKNPGSHQFLQKWKITVQTFNKYYLKRGERWDGALTNPSLSFGYCSKVLFTYLKRIWIKIKTI